jgi:hypothetical protein
MPKLTLSVVPELLCVHQLPPDSPIPPEVFNARWFSITRTGEETSIVLPADVPLSSTRCETDWIALQVAGPLDFALVGILAGISAVLALEKISIFALSTYDTDYILLKQDRLTEAILALRKADYAVIE